MYVKCIAAPRVSLQLFAPLGAFVILRLFSQSSSIHIQKDQAERAPRSMAHPTIKEPTRAMLASLATLVLVAIAFTMIGPVSALNVVVAGGTGKMGRALSSSLVAKGHDVTILCRNAFLAATPSRVSSDFGWLGESFIARNPRVELRDWDGGDLLDIVGQDWVGWQDNALKPADCVVNLVGGFTEQRTMATERIVRESLRVNPNAMQITISPIDDDLPMKMKRDRVTMCEKMVKENCLHSECFRAEVNDIDGACKNIMKVIDSL